MAKISMIACIDKQNSIGYKNKLLLKNKEDMNFFKEHTVDKVCVMGRKTYESLSKPLKNRTNVVLTNNKDYNPHKGVLVRHSINDVIDEFKYEDEIMVIGGEEIYRLFLPIADRLYLTKIHREFSKVDSYFPHIDNSWSEIYFKESQDGLSPMTFHIYKKSN